MRVRSVSSILKSNDLLRLSTSSTVMENAAVAANLEVGSLLALPSEENGVKAPLTLAFLV